MKTDPRFPSLHIVDHPLVQHKLSLMRDKRTSTRDFRELLNELSMLMGYELTRDFPVSLEEIETPVAHCWTPMLSGKKCVIVPVLRAGLGMSEGLLTLMPSARVGHIGLYRDENHRPVEYLVKLPAQLEGRTFIVVDPMVATGYSGAHAVDVLKKRGVPGDQIRFMSLVCAPEGVEVFTRLHPDVALYTAALDERLNEHAYIVPGLGDAGDRIFGTK
ncbi:uracil phosphoribosyltransferase [Sutterella sp.]|uniref:uracil phosphoribosyltransferase n=1 Tax=Sutterella sp. TaxID=1981025 RepID=UPI0026DFD4CB|nr:uracil phosphoribosyltransferase [Sutterella sp.]MDO5530627.1 uracil phosphoribosyltransferase [Sutterella sp.]